jgi:hypothetical protein
MSEEPLAALEAQLGEPPPEALRALGREQLVDLAGALRGARLRQMAELAAAGERAFDSLPRLLRGPVRKILG